MSIFPLIQHIWHIMQGPLIWISSLSLTHICHCASLPHLDHVPGQRLDALPLSLGILDGLERPQHRTQLAFLNDSPEPPVIQYSQECVKQWSCMGDSIYTKYSDVDGKKTQFMCLAWQKLVIIYLLYSKSVRIVKKEDGGYNGESWRAI